MEIGGLFNDQFPITSSWSGRSASLVVADDDKRAARVSATALELPCVLSQSEPGLTLCFAVGSSLRVPQLCSGESPAAAAARARRPSSATGPSADVAGGRLVVDHVNVTLGRLISLDESRAFSDTLCDGRRERSTTGPSHRQKNKQTKTKATQCSTNMRLIATAILTVSRVLVLFQRLD